MARIENAKLISLETGEEIERGSDITSRNGRKGEFLCVSLLPTERYQGLILVKDLDGPSWSYLPDQFKARIQPPIPASAVGCWLDGHMGWHNAYRVVNKAVEFGFKVPDDYKAVMDSYNAWEGVSGFEASLTEDEWESIHGQGELSDKATEWLEELAPKGFQFVWDAGELSLMPDEEAEMFHG